SRPPHPRHLHSFPTRRSSDLLISGARDVLDAANPRHAEKQKLLRHIRSLDVDCVVVDLGAGTGFNVLDFFLIADTGIVVLLPERSEEHTSELQSLAYLVCRLL